MISAISTKTNEIQKEEKRRNATNILYGWLQDNHIKPFQYFQVNRQYHDTKILEEDYFNIGIYEKWQHDNDVALRYKIRLCFNDETPDFQDHENDDFALGITGIYFIDVDWVNKQKIKPEYIKFSSSMDWYINGYQRNCTTNFGKCDPINYCCYNLPFRVKCFDGYSKIVSVDDWCDLKKKSHSIPCILCNKYTKMSTMNKNICCDTCVTELLRSGKVYFDISFSEKNTFKDLGGKWDFKRKKWYCDFSNDKLLELFKSSILY
jgi:hypothetical protein